MIKGTIFNIQKYSIHDGPGIRTTVFLKGCPLKCWWCHNPESLEIKEEIIYHQDKCIGCGDCAKGCPEEAVAFSENNVVIDKDNCILCGTCYKVCPTEAIEMIGKKAAPHEVMEEIEKDMVFYEESGGGVTFSGGEPLLQIEFLKSLLEKCKEKGIHTAVDTSGYAPYSSFEAIIDRVDLFLFDLKHMDDEKHLYYTGVSNEPILDNLRKLSKAECDVWIRIPIIPGINDDDYNILKTGEYIVNLGLSNVNILPYHNIAVDKYERLGREYSLRNIKSPSDESINRISESLKGFGLKVKIGG